VQFVVSRLVAVLPFVIFALFLPFVGQGKDADFLGIAISTEGVWAMWNILAKAVLGGLASILLAATTETPDILKGFSRLKVPGVITAIASFMIRYLEVIAGELARMRIAMTARGYDPRWLWQSRPIAASAGTLFIRSYERGERIYEAMLSRGYTGDMPMLGGDTATRRQWTVAMTIPAIALVVALTALVTV
jgi:cobalt/nickel transport system permease protein